MSKFYTATYIINGHKFRCHEEYGNPNYPEEDIWEDFETELVGQAAAYTLNFDDGLSLNFKDMGAKVISVDKVARTAKVIFNDITIELKYIGEVGDINPSKYVEAMSMMDILNCFDAGMADHYQLTDIGARLISVERDDGSIIINGGTPWGKYKYCL